MPNLLKIITVSIENKPKKGQPCNSCGYWCLTEVCPVGVELTGSDIAPCKLLITEGDKHTCILAQHETTRKVLGIGTGCCAETQQEVITRIHKGLM